ncbi:MAG: nickel-dependent lactate racemase [Deltaproteobacteria bacterium]|uniref:Nickel-dependent lactate racemase n=1 Tax=Candidatus Zymogenus saltonus TaxID=2844893 RepID=A0A9D8KIC4_9DELT|nr:nickel-dependent lactate racemase [Candidatus Zymogenus saltonus]
MKVKFDRELFGSLEIDDADLVGILEPKIAEGGESLRSMTERAIEKPIGTNPFRELLFGKKRILIITDDVTRPTPVREIAEVMLTEITKAGIRDKDVMFLISLGTHRAMTEGEIKKRFGEEISARYRIFNHSWDKPETLIDMGSTETGIEIYVNREVKNADLIVAVGNIVPHATTGFSGGGKIIVPGIAGEETTEGTHWAALDYEMEEILGVNDNPIRRDVNDIALKAGLDFIVNSVLDIDENPAGVVAGHPVEAHNEGVEIARRIYGSVAGEKADVVVCDASPTDINLRQSIKGVAAADVVVKRGGAIVLIAECPEGIAPQFPQFLEIGFKDPEGLKSKVEAGEIKGRIMAYTLIAIGRVMKKASVILVTKGISGEEARRMGFLHEPDPVSAYRRAVEIAGGRKTIFMRKSGELLPMIAR